MKRLRACLGAVNAIALYDGSTAANMVGLFGINTVLRPLVMYSILGLVGVLDIYILLMVPGLSGGVGATNIVHSVASGVVPTRPPDPAAQWGR
ncbi:Uncharacterised protein [uncultured archaeon]|nr:Uncharacterised protein [uncultured archaeon]